MPWSRSLHFLLIATLIPLILMPRTAKGGKSPAKIVVLDVTAESDSLNRGFVFDPDSKLPGSSNLILDDLEKLAGKVDPDIDALLKHIRKSGGLSSRRWLSKKGDQVAVFIFRPESYVLDLKIEEKGRQTQFGSDVATLFKAIAVKGKALESEETTISRGSWRLEKTRATLTIHASPTQLQQLVAGMEGLAVVGDLEWSAVAGFTRVEYAASSEARPKEKKLQTAEVALTTGPTEHWYLSTSVPLSTVREVQYVDSTGTFEPRNKPKKFLIGANFLLGDILSEEHSIIGGLAPGVFVEASSKPFESFGVSLSYRFPARDVFGIEFELVTPFWGLIRTTSDSRTESGAVERNENVVYKGVWGLSLNLDKVASWLNGE